jgi:hypothetical protein
LCCFGQRQVDLLSLWKAISSPLSDPRSAPDPPGNAAELELIQQLTRYCRRLHWGATALQSLTVLTALAAIVLSLLVATYTGSGGLHPGLLKLLAFLSAICTALFSGFRLRSKAADLRTAFRILNADLMRYRIGDMTASDLIASYSKAEERIGQVEVDGLGDQKPQDPTQ